ncbi:GfV-E1-ORF1 [Ichnoviriform fumiferanae]|uniref:GfV-E1-ORF1 n=1 Tax=Ichnoviriform fumiferanae TaxID=419435 RepID=A2Q000_9VIRU|nr:GfV-E1-ORF1 [Ichnoviriform fumiferanae]BAF45572.1 GfV-E1-ORF1 [Ichnoviriform fumiferanae]
MTFQSYGFSIEGGGGKGTLTEIFLFLLSQNLIWKYYESQSVHAVSQLSCKYLIYGKKVPASCLSYIWGCSDPTQNVGQLKLLSSDSSRRDESNEPRYLTKFLRKVSQP